MIGRWTGGVLVLSAFWILYAALFSQTILFHDSFGYQKIGEQFLQGRVMEYFHQGPNREPLYPLFVAVNMRLADLLHIPYTNLILLSQGLVLLITQLAIAFIFARVGVADKVSAAVLFYFAVSPSILRSSLIVYSEILTYPLMLSAVVVACRVWLKLLQGKSAWRQGMVLGSIFIPLVMIKGIFELIAPLFILIVCLRLIRHTRNIKRAVIFGLAALVVFMIPVLAVKIVNKLTNDQFAFTNRGSWALYGTAARRVMAPTPAQLLAQKLYVFPDKSLCEKWAGPEACGHWHYTLSDQLGREKYAEIQRQGLTLERVDQQLNRASLALMAGHPWATLRGMFWEGSKLFLWEYPSWGMVVLPRELRAYYQSPMFYQAAIWGVNVLNLAVLITGVFWLSQKLPEGCESRMLFMTLLMILLYTGAHSMFFLNERNALPVVPLYFVLAGIVISKVLMRRRGAQPCAPTED